MEHIRGRANSLCNLLREDVRGQALMEFAIVLPLLVVFVVGIFDFSAAFNQKQKVAQAAQEGAILAGAQPMSDIGSNPISLRAVAKSVENSLLASGVLATGTCTAPITVANTPPSLIWTYTWASCPLTVTINRGWSAGTAPVAVGTSVQVTYPYSWRFGSVIQLIGGSANLPLTISETAAVHNQ